MKKLILLALCAALAGGASALAEGTTLAALKAAAPNYYQASVAGADGETVEIFAPVVLPQGDAMPVLRCRVATFDASNMTDVYPRDPNEPAYMRIAGTYWNVKDTPLLCVVRNWDHGDGSTVHKRLTQGNWPPLVDVTTEQAKEIMLEEAARFGCEIVPELALERAVPYSGLHAAKPGTFFEAGDAVAGGERGLWDIRFAQVIRGARVLSGSIYYPTGEIVDGQMEWWGYVTTADIDVSAQDAYAMTLCVLVEEDELAEDCALLPFDELIGKIEARIGAGQLRSVYTLTLGYYPFYEQGKERNDWIVDENGNAVQDPHSTATYVLLPVWRVQGYDVKDAHHAGGQTPDREEVLCHDPGDPEFELLLDARTGEPLASRNAADVM